MIPELDQIAAASRHYGANPEYVFGGGGNTSCKTDDALYIKPSGTSLATIQPADFVKMDRQAVRELFAVEVPDDPHEREAKVKDLMMAAVCSDSAGRPSVETPMHELFPQTYVVHTHNTLMNGLTCAKQAEKMARKLFPKAMWVPYVDPGFTLSREMHERIEAYQKTNGHAPDVAIMQNHGLVVAGDSIEAIDAKHAELRQVLLAEYEKADVAIDLVSKPRDMETIAAHGPVLRTLLGTETSRCLIHASGWFKPAEGPYTPDHIVYAKSFAFSGQPTIDTLDHFNKHRGYDPIILEVGDAIFAAGPSLKSARLAMEAARNAAHVQQLTEAFGGPHFLNERQYGFIENWEVENYRKQVTLGGDARPKRLHGKVALVTGAAQGFGYGIAKGMAREGATLIIADINLDGAEEAAGHLNDACGAGSAFAVAVNIADEESVASMARTIAAECGGLDILIANAGVLRASSVKTFKKTDWDFVTNVNYTGYFLCVKHLSPIMARQIVEGRGGWMDIIQINSKSGLEGSNRNAAYAGGKFGGIGLTQSFALELVEDRIKVNAICPGNFFDGPLWSDPERGLFAQYLRTGKVPGASTVGEVKAAYEQKVPMGRGCTPEDVLKAILYCVDQDYETGQAIPVTGGQVMLR